MLDSDLGSRRRGLVTPREEPPTALQRLVQEESAPGIAEAIRRIDRAPSRAGGRGASRLRRVCRPDDVRGLFNGEALAQGAKIGELGCEETHVPARRSAISFQMTASSGSTREASIRTWNNGARRSWISAMDRA
jgi:hypothetical protein